MVSQSLHPQYCFIVGIFGNVNRLFHILGNVRGAPAFLALIVEAFAVTACASLLLPFDAVEDGLFASAGEAGGLLLCSTRRTQLLLSVLHLLLTSSDRLFQGDGQCGIAVGSPFGLHTFALFEKRVVACEWVCFFFKFGLVLLMAPVPLREPT